MNYLDYKRIMKEEQLEESRAVKLMLENPKSIMKFWKRIHKTIQDPSNDLKKTMHADMTVKDDFIKRAILVARVEKEQQWKFIEDSEVAILSIMKLEKEGRLNRYALEFLKVRKELIQYFLLVERSFYKGEYPKYTSGEVAIL